MKPTRTRYSQHALLALGFVFSIFAAPGFAYDQPWNGYREDITRNDPNTEDEDCKTGKCPEFPSCNSNQSPLYNAKGYLVITEKDIELPNASIGLSRTYNSFDRRAGLFGRGWVTKQEVNIARTYKAVTENPNTGISKTATEFDSAPIFLTEYGRRYRLTETETSCTTPDVLFFTFEKQVDGSFKQVYEDRNDYAIFSSEGQMLESYSDKEGVAIYYEYDNEKRLIRQHDGYGFSLDFSYNEQGFVSKVTDNANRSWHYTYNDNGTLKQVQDPDGNTKDYSYKTVDHTGYKDHLLTGIHDNGTDPRLNVTWSQITLYNGKSQRVASYTEEDGKRHTYTYSQSSYNGIPTVRTIKRTYQVGSTSIVTETQTFQANRDTYQILQFVNNTNNTQATKTYNSQAKVIDHIDRRGNRTLYEYNEAGNTTKVIEFAGTADERIITYTYWNDTDRVALKYEYGLRETQMTYDAHLRIETRSLVDLATGEQRVWQYSYHPNTTDPNGNLILGKLASVDAPQAGSQDSYTLAYDSNGLLTSVTNPLNQSSVYDHNAVGQTTSFTDLNGVTSQYTYNSRNNLISTNRNGRSYSFAYNGQDQLVEVTDPLGRSTSFAYSDTNALSRITFPAGDYLALSYNYAAVTRITQRYYSEGDVLLSTSIRDVDPDHMQTTATYLNSTASPVSQSQYNALEELSQLTQHGQFGANTTATYQYSYDKEGQLSQVIDSLNGNTQLSYDDLNRLTQVIDANGGQTQYQYTAWQELTQTVSPDTGVTTYQVDSRGNTVAETKANNLSSQYIYDADNRLVAIDFGGTALDTQLTYDAGSFAKGRLSSATDGSGSSQFSYDDRGLITGHTANVAGLSLNTQYDYNAADELTALTYPSGLQVDMPLDAAGRLTAITATIGGNTQQVVNSFSWQGQQLQSYQHGNGLSTTLSYDAAGRLTGKQFGSSNSFNNQLDNQGQITQQTWTQSGNQDVAAYEYDLLGRLSKDGSPDSSSWLYDYDAVGNRLSEQRDNATALTDYDYEANSNRMSQINTTAITLDPAGNTLDDGFRQYQYNAMNRLAQVNHTQNGLQASYTYNFMGQRVRKVISGSQSSDSRYFYGPQGELLGEYDVLGNRVYEYIYRPDTEYPELMAVVNATGDILHVHTDHLMTPRQVTDSSQTVVWQWLSEAFGQTLANEDPDGDSQTVTLSHRFPGQHFDSESGLHYNYFRYYDPNTGRYITSDPIGLAGGINTFLYAEANALENYDNNGLLGMKSVTDYLIKKASENIGKRNSPTALDKALKDTLEYHYQKEYEEYLACKKPQADAEQELIDKIENLRDPSFSSFPNFLDKKTYEDYKDKTWPAVKDRYNELVE